jgi:hypothetical protein
MLHLEQGFVYKIDAVDDGFGGLKDEVLTLLPKGPKWYTLKQVGGTMQAYKGRAVSDYEFELKCNFKDDFVWQNEYVVFVRGYFIKISSVIETDRLRGITLLGNNLPSESWQIASA